MSRFDDIHEYDNSLAGAGLQLDTVRLVEVPEVVGLQEHVRELGVRDAVLALDAAAHRVLGDHLVDREVLAHVAQELEHRDRRGRERAAHHVLDHGGFREGQEARGFEAQQPAADHHRAAMVIVLGVGDHPLGVFHGAEREDARLERKNGADAF